ncbi:MAG: hypothetical protein ABIO79_04820 [Ferruginibacter sp.]
MPNYNLLHIQTLEVILTMHEKHRADMLADPDAKAAKLMTLQHTIAKVKHAIRMKNCALVV